ncbi:MAG: nicotinate-nucleotide--dimethylbenzimidazole phosphoribosyltransferase [Commensalibacter sp.]|nr:nicotinate-nucleotide--dimethylbenzimidazole phosphoribosyltransferase [Commensalibacter sp.]
MTDIQSIEQLVKLFNHLPTGDRAADEASHSRNKALLKPPGSLGELENLVGWLAYWQKQSRPTLDKVRILIFAGNHGVTAEKVTPYDPSITKKMVENFRNGNAAINQLAKNAQADLDVIEVNGLKPTRNFCYEPAMEELEFLEAIATGYHAVQPDTDLLVLGEMGIGNTTAAAALCTGLFGGDAEQWTGNGTTSNKEIIEHKKKAVRQAIECHKAILDNPLQVARHLGGYELAALLGAILAARHLNIPVLLDGFVCTASVAPLYKLHNEGLDHARLGHLSAEKGHLLLAGHLNLYPLLALNMRLGEASGAAVAVPILRAALSCYNGMITYQEAGLPLPD